MNIRTSLMRALTLALPLSSAVQILAVEISFTATIDESPFLTPGYTVGSVINGWYTYDPGAAPSDSGANYTNYPISGMHLLLDEAENVAWLGRLNLYHFLPQLTPNAVDCYDLFGFGLAGPTIEGFSPASAELTMTDTDNSVYAFPPPLPIDFPDPGLFELQSLRIVFLTPGPLPLVSREIDARVDCIARVPAGPNPVPDGVSSLWLLCPSIALINWLRKRRVG